MLGKNTGSKMPPDRGMVGKNTGNKLPPERGIVGMKTGNKITSDSMVGMNIGNKLPPDRGMVGMNTGPDKGMVGMKVVKGGLTQTDKEKTLASERLRIGKEVCSRRKPSRNVQPLGKLRKSTKDSRIEMLPKLRMIDTKSEKEQHIQRIIKSLNLNPNPHYKNSTKTSNKSQPVIKNTSGIDFASSLMESHNLTLKQLRDFWQDMPSFLNVQAAKLKSKYGVVESEAADDIDDISIEIVKQWNKPTALLPKMEFQNSRSLYVVEEES
jgi:hypothetical protein